jgi:hypothetical protein
MRHYSEDKKQELYQFIFGHNDWNEGIPKHSRNEAKPHPVSCSEVLSIDFLKTPMGFNRA